MGSRHFLRVATVILAWTSLFTTACTREVPLKASLSINMPSSVGGLSGTPDKLEIVIINARAGGAGLPRVWEFEFENSSIYMGSTVPLSVQGDIPSSKNLLIQVLGVFKTPAGGMRFVYGDSTADSTKSGDINVTVTTALFGSSTGEGRVAGRYITAETPNVVGPTGSVITLFSPPVVNGTARPDMAVMKSDIINGWFNVMVLKGTQAADQISLKYLIEKTDGSTEWLLEAAMNYPASRMNLSHPIFASSGVLSAEKVTAKTIIPARYRYEQYDSFSPGEFEAEPESEMILGFFRKDSGAVASWTSYYACFDTGVMALERYYRDSDADDIPDTPLAYQSGTGLTTFARNDFGSTIANCTNPNNATETRFYAARVADQRGDAFGMRGPFRLVDATARPDEGYLTVDLNPTGHLSSYPKVTLNWAWVPGVYAPQGSGNAGVDGVTIFMRYMDGGFGGGGGGKDDDMPCDQQAISEGYTPIGTVNTYVLGNNYGKKFEVTSPLIGGNFSMLYGDPDSVSSYGYKVCPYKLVGANLRYYSEGLESRCIGSCMGGDDMMGFGNKAPGYAGHNNVIGPSTYPYISALGGASRRITGVSLGVSTTITINSGASDFAPGDEAALVVMSTKGMSSPCGVGPMGEEIRGGMSAFTRVVSNNATNLVTIPAGTLADGLVAATGLNDAISADPHCYVSLVRVAQFASLTVGNGSQIQQDKFNPGPADGNPAGGITIIRVNDTLTMDAGSSIMAVGSGFGSDVYNAAPSGQAGTGYGISGALGNNAGFGSISGRSGGGGGHADLITGLGGGGVGSGTVTDAVVPGEPPGMMASMSGWGLHMVMGSSGGAGWSTSSFTNTGGFGGGIIVIFARRFHVNGAGTSINASGLSGAGSDGSAGGGGGGGAGTIILQVGKMTSFDNSTKPIYDMTGGMGGAHATFAKGGGGGSGGYFKFRSCTNTGVPGAPGSYFVAGGARASAVGNETAGKLSSAGQNGYATVARPVVPQNDPAYEPPMPDCVY